MRRARLLLVAAAVASSSALQGCAIVSGYMSGGIEGAIAGTAESAEAGKNAIERIDAKDERAVGQAAAISVIEKNGGLILEEELNRYVNEVGNLVALKGERKTLVNGSPRLASRRVFVGVLDSKNVNAFSLPGGYVLVTRGLLESLGSESELAWVLGHEISHADGEDGLNALKAQVASGAFLTGGATDFKNSKFFASMTDGIVSILLNKGWDSKAEKEADKSGLAYAAAAGYDPRGAQRVLRLLNVTWLQQQEKSKDGKKDATHASPEERWSALSAKVDELEKAGKGAMMVERYETQCIARLDAYVAAAPSSAQGGSH